MNRARSCVTCFGEGEIVGEDGPSLCPDCDGDGKQPTPHELVERRLRQIENSLTAEDDEGPVPSDRRWLVHELRRSRQALLRIFSVCQDAEGREGSALDEVKFLSNDTLGLFEPEDL